VVCGGRKQALRVLIRELARAKGLPDRVTEPDARYFFATRRKKGPDKVDRLLDKLFG
jgi:hypothetical protein